MRLRFPGVVLLFAATAAAGCARPIRLEPRAPAGSTQDWSTTLQPSAPATDVRGAASVQASAGTATVVVSLTGVAAGSRLAWRIHRGRCGETGPTVGDSAAYLPLEAGASGRAAAQAVVQAALDPGAEYAVDVHATADPVSAVIACGQLQVGVAGSG